MNGGISMEKTQHSKSASSDTGSTFRVVDYNTTFPGVFGLHFDLPGQKVNKLDDKVMGELDAQIQKLATRSDIKALVIFSDKEGIFIAGADIQMIQGVHDKETGTKLAASGQTVIAKLEKLKFPVIAAVNGACMGGGTELALCCKMIVTSDSPSTKIALPEVNLGILPGFGGTVRLPERIGLQAAMDYILSGKTMDGQKAVKVGLADACVPAQDFKNRVLKIAADVAAGKFRSQKRAVTGTAKLQKTLLEMNPIGRAVLFSQAKKMILSRTRGKYPAPLKILELLNKQAGASRDKKLKLESIAFGELAVTDVSKRLIELFFATEGIKKQSGVPGFKLDPKDKVTRMGLLGAGVMGGGIAQLMAHRNIPVRMKDISYAGLSAGMAASSKIFAGLVKKRKLTKREADIRLGLISPTLDYSGFGAVDLVIEAVLEDMNVKKKVIKDVEPLLAKNTIFATNTSSLSVTEMA
ncbi:MAG TPA: enoyl-CoA hydratase-related protein, partial [Oligoflexia bacterium]|nr:enoyl-CoA hydratase-related protein [Oligoflexia bacterium]